MSFDSQSVAMKMRDIITFISDQRISALRPAPRIGQVVQINRDAGNAQVMFAGEPDPFNVSFGLNSEPSLINDIVRVAGSFGSYYIQDVITRMPWTPVIYTGLWVDWGTPYGGVQLRKEGGWVYLRGVCKSGALNTPIFTLDEQFRPGQDEILAGVGSHSATGAVGTRVDVKANGDVVPPNTTFNNTYVSLSGIRFRAEQ